ncbi:E3 ubiquitin-protein ligase KEG [Zea mays]|uniref:RING-type E3 ubiquitin transferase n=9 Tax=Zea mays TaxID=4577 RepID=A0A1D6FR90_MAIZE|nr:E3 ubiquitin-protein ligase KEG [Zea mays]AQK94106.1 E3 ubiquitin-protein ligase KEG [Zea mays]AQK94117.1 E3 ubiquitin-protein ligase KEG [Zea mays]AQK94120.1 E3 ubiquitin-protein ligase KEG [Zea mays]|eukprot:XP_008656340.1 E3 ubiquitin-protein ligase KEG [Zea mays]
MRVPCCSLCNVRYDEEERTPLLLHCGHGFCRACLSRMLAAAPGATLPCPRCRHPTAVGNSVSALRKNFPILSLLSASPSSPSFLHSDSGSSSDGSEDEDDFFARPTRRPAPAPAAASPGCSSFDLASHPDLKLARRIGSGPPGPAGQDVWVGTLSRGGGGVKRCKHQVAVKRVPQTAGDGLEVVQEEVERLRRASTWCRNVCTFHGAVRVGGHLCFVMDHYVGSVQAEMRQNGGRLTLEQILRYGADIARGVAELHAAGIVCMSIKPSNILLDAHGHAVVSDYGLSAILKNRRVPDDSGAGIDAMLLSPNYTAPEAWGPLKKSLNMFWDSANGISPESDAWSFGCTLVEMCTGAVPWAGLTAEEICKSVAKEKKPPPQYSRVVGVGLPGELWKMIGECLQFRASRRPSFQDMLKIFLRHLLDIPRSPPASPENDFANENLPNGMEPPTTSILEMVRYNPNALHHLVCEGDAAGVRDLLAKVASERNGGFIRSLLEAQNTDGLTALHLACRRGSAELVEAIVAYQENVDILDKDEDPPIVFALAAGSPRCVRALVGRSASINSRLREGLGPTLAHVCAHHGQPECMQELLMAGADPNAVDGEGESVLHIAVARRYTDCAIAILENGGCRSMGISNSQHKTPLHLCVETWNTTVVRRWVDVASLEDIAEAIDVPSPVGTALCMAAALKKEHEKEGRELVRILLAAGADPTAQDDPHCRTALHTAAMINDVELVKIILEAGVDVNIRNAQNTTPLHVALNRGANSCVGLLLASGANCNIQDDDGDNAFHIAADAAKMIRENLTWIAQMLLQPSPAVDVRNHRGWTLRDFLERLPREWIYEELMEMLEDKGVHLSPTIYEVADWVKFRRTVTSPAFGWQGAGPRSIGFVQSVVDNDHLAVSFCTGEAHVLTSEVIKVIPLNRGQHVQLKPDVSEPRFGWRGQSRDSIGTVLCVDDDGILRVGFPGASRGWRADPAEIERVEEYKVGNWVRIRPSLTVAVHGMESITPGSVGIVYSIRPDSSLLLGLCYLSNPWLCEPEEVEHVDPFKIGDQVCVKRSVAEPRYAWGGETHHSVGKIIDIESDGLLIIDIPNRAAPWQADPSDMEKIENFKVGDWIRVKVTVPSPKYGWEDVTRNSIGIIHSLQDDGDVGVAFCFRSKLFLCSVADIEKAQPFEVGEKVHVSPSISEPRLGWLNETAATIGAISRIDMDGTLNIKVSGRKSLWKVAPGDAERLSAFEVGDWVRPKPSIGSRPTYDWNSVGRINIAVVHSIQDSGYLELAGCFRHGKWLTHNTDIEKVQTVKIGQHVRFRAGISEPRWGWRDANPDSRGIIAGVHADGEVRVAFFGVPGLWRGDPADLEIENIFEVGEWVRLRNDVEQWRSLKPGSIGVVHGVGYQGDAWDGTIHVAFCGEQERWIGPSSQLEGVSKFVVGQRVRIRGCIRQPRFGWSNHSHSSIGTISSIDADGKLRIHTPAGARAWLTDPAEVEKVEDEEEVCIGDWVKVKDSVGTPVYQWGDVNHSSIGVVHRADDGELWIAFCFCERLWLCKAWEVEKVRPFRQGDKVRIRSGLVSPRWGWGMETYASKGEVVGVDANGKLRIKFRWRDRLWIGDPADVVLDDAHLLTEASNGF